jgi:hypothetical protein
MQFNQARKAQVSHSRREPAERPARPPQPAAIDRPSSAVSAAATVPPRRSASVSRRPVGRTSIGLKLFTP